MGSRCALVVDDEAVSRVVLAHMLRKAGWEVQEAYDVASALESLAAQPADIVFSDFSMPDGTGLDLLAALSQNQDRPHFVLVTGLIEHVDAVPVDLESVDGRLTKPISTRSLAACLDGIFPPNGASESG